MLTFKRDYFVRRGLRTIRIALRACHELNTGTTWGDRGYRRAYGMMLLQTAGDYLLVREAMRRYFAVFLDVFGNAQPGIADDHAYTDWQLWPHWNSDKDHKGGQDVRLTCPPNAKLVGSTSTTTTGRHLYHHGLVRGAVAAEPEGWPVGLQAWLAWARSTGRPLASASGG